MIKCHNFMKKKLIYKIFPWNRFHEKKGKIHCKSKQSIISREKNFSSNPISFTKKRFPFMKKLMHDNLHTFFILNLFSSQADLSSSWWLLWGAFFLPLNMKQDNKRISFSTIIVISKRQHKECIFYWLQTSNACRSLYWKVLMKCIQI